MINSRPSRLSRSQFLKFAAMAAGALGVARAGALSAAPRPASPRPATTTLSAADVLKELLEGNARFARGEPLNPRRGPEDYRALGEGQNPAAVILGCADSRVPPELIFDVGVGDLFVIRVAGNVVAGAGAPIKGSAEYAVAELNVPLIMVLGHTGCGAVKAAVKHIDSKDSLPGAISELVDLIKPAVLRSRGQPGNPLDNAIRANVKLGVERLKGLKPILAARVKQGRLKVVGGVYDLGTGVVTLVG